MKAFSAGFPIQSSINSRLYPIFGMASAGGRVVLYEDVGRRDAAVKPHGWVHGDLE
ncbi:hypothetical protein GCM10007392_20580 [Saccharospirillum salsuginis]|uniref:Uncharacterized protein n=1 Tax=Saccharospirillum salsuginis TaxID=418750 RepID=A0A918N999_9GAMM|nr:hypothetical protein GCM10007392_20580 [Saccharospirillum salsuginis]